MPAEVHSTEELATLLDANKFVVVDFYASWCPPCKAIAPLYQKLAGEHAVDGGLAFAKVNVDDVPDVAKAYSVTAMPTFMFFERGKPVAVDADVRTAGAQRGPNGVDLIKGADPRALTACVSKLGELAKKAGPAASAPAADGPADPAAVSSGPDPRRTAPSSSSPSAYAYSYSSPPRPDGRPRRADWRTSLRP